jgi:CRP/FNR family transcriptional regulator, anaerobic regulatory protein
MKKIIAILFKVFPLTEEAKTYLYENTYREEYRKWDKLLNPGEICRHVWYIEKGLIHSFEALSRDRNIGNWFMFEKDIATSVVSFFTETPSEETVEALENCVVWRMSRADLYKGIKLHPSLLMLTFLIVVKYYCETRKMESLLKKKKPEELVAFLAEHRGEMLKRLPKNRFAAFLGITETTFYKLFPKK